MNKNLKIIVTGVKGQLGFDVVRELKKRGYINVLGIDKEELDITDETAVHQFIDFHKPQIVIHNAAWTAVDKAEEMPEAVYKVNSLAVKYLAEACQNNNATMMYISTDYVFNGQGDKYFEIDDKKDGLSVYGKTKSQGEDFLIQTLKQYFIIRISWVFGVNGNNFVKTMLKLAESKKEISVVCDQFGSPTYTYDLSILMCDMIETKKYGIYHASNEGVCSWAEFAKEIFKKAHCDVTILPVTTAEYKKMIPFQANRPLNSRMSKKSLTDNGFSLLPPWEDALDRYLKEINK